MTITIHTPYFRSQVRNSAINNTARIASLTHIKNRELFPFAILAIIKAKTVGMDCKIPAIMSVSTESVVSNTYQ